MVLIPPILLVLRWFIKGQFDKHINIKPRLFLKLGKPLYGQRFKGYQIGHELTWCFECELKNNSKHDAYNLQLIEVKDDDLIISNRTELRFTFQENSHLESNESINFDIKKTISVGPDVLTNSKIENGTRVILPGLKVRQPELALKPKCLNNIRLIIKYENEKGKTFYTKFRSLNGIDKSSLSVIRPFWFKRTVR